MGGDKRFVMSRIYRYSVTVTARADKSDWVKMQQMQLHLKTCSLSSCQVKPAPCFLLGEDLLLVIVRWKPAAPCQVFRWNLLLVKFSGENLLLLVNLSGENLLLVIVRWKLAPCQVVRWKPTAPCQVARWKETIIQSANPGWSCYPLVHVLQTRGVYSSQKLSFL